MIQARVHSRGLTVTVSADGLPTAIHIEREELRFGAEAVAIRVLELTHAAARAAHQELR